MLSALYLPFASMPSAMYYDARSPSQLNGFTLNYYKPRLNVTVGKSDESNTFEIKIEAFDGVFRQHMAETSTNKWAIKFGHERSVNTASIVDGQHLLFAEITNEGEAKELLRLIDLIVRVNQRHSLMIQDFVGQYGEALQCEWQDDTSSLHIHGRRGNVSVYDTSNLVLVYIQSDDKHCIFERYLRREFSPAPEQDPCSSCVLSYDGGHFPGAEHIEDEIYMFSFHFPCDEAQIRMLVDAAVNIIKAHA
jgi:hypothetical protein